MFSFTSNKRVAIDLGNNNTLVTDDRQILLSEPSYILFDEMKRSLKAVFSQSAARIVAFTPQSHRIC